MAITTLDPNTALIIIDLQKGIVGLPMAHSVEHVVARAASLADAFRARGLPVVLVNVDGGAPGRTEQGGGSWAFPDDWAELVQELNASAQDIRVTKRTWGAFARTDLESRLRTLGVTQVVIAGIATGAGVESTAQEAHALGFNVTLAVDAMSDRSEEVHQSSVTRIFPRIGETGSAQDILAHLGAA